MNVALSIIIPTIGRESLKRLLEELLPQVGESDEILVTADGEQPAAKAIVSAYAGRVVYLEVPGGPTKDWGHSPRNFSMRQAKGTHIWSVDDDDRVAPNAISTIKAALVEAPGRPHIFRMHHFYAVIWEMPSILEGRVSTQLFVVPNTQGRLGRWGKRYEGDFDFIRETVGLYPEKDQAIVWRSEIIVLHRIASNAERDPAVARWNSMVDNWQWSNSS